MPESSIPLKTCCVCKQQFPATTEYFHRDKRGQHGLAYRCKNCAKATSRQWRNANLERARQSGRDYAASHRQEARDRAKAWAEAHPERFKSYHAQYYREHKEELNRANVERDRRNPERRKARVDRWIAIHPARRREIARNYACRNRPKIRENGRQWRLANPEKNKFYKAKRKGRIMQAEGTHTAADIRAIYAEQEGRCAYCGITLHGDYHLDHFVPLVRGGSNWPHNLKCACLECNLSKGDKLYAEWEAMRGW